MEAYPPQYVEHNLPLVLLSGLGREAEAGQTGTQSRRQESGARIVNESPLCQGERSSQLLQEFQALDGTGNPWNSNSLPGPVGTIRYKMRAIGRDYSLPPRKAAPLPQSPDAGNGPLTRNSELHSPLSPLSPGSPIFPDGLFTPLWFSKHQEQVPCLLLAFFDLNVGESTSQDDRIKADINAIRNAILRSGFKTRFAAVLLGDKSILHAPELEDRLSAVRRATGLDPKTSLFFMPPIPTQAETATFAQTLMITLQPSLIEYYRDLTKHARRKKARGGPSAQATPQGGHASHLIPPAGWSVRYEAKQGVFAEFRQEMDVAERHYTAAIDELFNPEGIFETTSSWNVRWDQARLLGDAMAMRILRCHLWTGQTVAATQVWIDYKARVKDLVDRRGKGSQTYGWDAWEARWAGVMSQLIRLADVPGLQKPAETGGSTAEMAVPNVYAVPEKAFSSTERLIPFNLMHHSGYWLKLFAKGIRARWEKALSLPEEDRIPPGRSPASTMVKRSKSYDTYLVCEPHEEFPLSGPGRFDYAAELGTVCAQATAEFEARGQVRMTEQMRLDLAHDLAQAGRFVDATQVLVLLWEESSWREEDWHSLFCRLLRLLSDCIDRAKSLENARIVPALTWELLSLRVPEDLDAAVGIGNCLDDWDLSEKISIDLHDKQRLCPVSASCSFKERVSYVGESVGFQVVLKHEGSEISGQIEMTSVEIQLDTPSLITLQHKGNDVPGPESPRSHFQSPRLEEREDGSIAAHADLTLSPRQVRIYSLDMMMRKSQVLRAVRISLSVGTSRFDLRHNFTEGAIQPSPFWYVDKEDEVEELLLPNAETRSIRILPKPPKMQIVFDDLEEQYYTDERIHLSINVINEETEEVDAVITPTIVGQNGRALSFDLQEADDGGAQRTISNMQSSSEVKTKLIFQAPSEASNFTIQIELSYSLKSDLNTPLSKTITAEVSIVAPFDARFIFGPIFNPATWPSYFDPSSKGSKESPDGITQRWSLGARIAALSTQAVRLQRTELRLNHIEVDASCEIEAGLAEPEQTLRPHKRVLSPFEFTTQKFSFDDRRPSYLDLSLVLTWSRDGVPAATTSVIPVPRLTIPTSEPRVLCTVSEEASGGADAVLQYHLENPSGHFLTFALTMEANDDFAFSGPKYRTLSLAPLSRHHVEYRILIQPNLESSKDEDGVWVSPVFHVVDSYYQKTLRVQPGGIGVKLNEKKEPTVFSVSHVTPLAWHQSCNYVISMSRKLHPNSTLAETMDAEDQNARFAIHAACREGQIQKVESLLNADRRLASRRDDDDRLPLHWASSYNHLPIVEILCDQKGSDIDARDGAGWTALMMASSLKDGDALVDALFAKGADPDTKTNNGQTALHFAASKSNLDTVRKLLAHKASARVSDKRRQLPLHRAAAVGNVPIIKLLLQSRSPINATDIDGSTALHHAIAEGHGAAAVELLKAGAETDKKDGNGALAINLAPEGKIRSYILRAAEEEGIELATS